MAGGAALITAASGVAGAGATSLGGKAIGVTAARVAADAVRLHVVTQLVLRDVDGNEEAAKAVLFNSNVSRGTSFADRGRVDVLIHRMVDAGE